MTAQQCDHCEGIGLVWEPCHVHGHLDYCPPSCQVAKDIPCLNCDGSGTVTKAEEQK